MERVVSRLPCRKCNFVIVYAGRIRSGCGFAINRAGWIFLYEIVEPYAQRCDAFLMINEGPLPAFRSIRSWVFNDTSIFGYAPVSYVDSSFLQEVVNAGRSFRPQVFEGCHGGNSYSHVFSMSFVPQAKLCCPGPCVGDYSSSNPARIVNEYLGSSASARVIRHEC